MGEQRGGWGGQGSQAKSWSDVVGVGSLGRQGVRGTGGAGQAARRRGRKGDRHRGRAWALLPVGRLWVCFEGAFYAQHHVELAEEWAQFSRSAAELHSIALWGGMFFVEQKSPAQSAYLAAPSTRCPQCPVLAPGPLQTLSSHHFQMVSGGRAALGRGI